MSAKLIDKPLVMDLEPGTYWYCTCGRSAKYPFCDGTHKVAGVHEPVKFEIEEARKVAICQCGRTAKPPFCDGAHRHKG